MPPYTCSRCNSIPLELFYGEVEKYEHSPTLQALEESVERGCRCCQIFLDALLPNTKSDTELDGAVMLYVYCEQYYDGKVLGPFSVEISCGRLRFGRRPISWLIDPGTPQQKMLCAHGHPDDGLKFLGPDLDCDTNIHLMRALIEDCFTNHPNCQHGQPSSLPTRLLDLGEDSIVLSVRVVPGTHCEHRQHRYLTLSHCWGIVPPAAPWRLTTERSQDYANNVPFGILPRTFQEAVTLTKQLGERYLWIDSLCILQDSLEDWALEASKMADVYCGSVCTLSTATNSASGGCFLPRVGVGVTSVELRLSRWMILGPSKKENSSSIVLFPGIRAFSEDPKTPVLGRAWTLQERELSVRIIQFTDREFRWKCNTLATSEDTLYQRNYTYQYQQLNRILDQGQGSPPRQLRGTERRSDGITSVFLKSPSFAHFVSKNDRKGAYLYWYSIVEMFSNCAITYQSDRPAALQGLAKRHTLSFPDTLLAGIWESDLRSGLLWRRKLDWDHMPHRGPDDLPTPTWSWLCLEGPVQFVELERSLLSPPSNLKLWVEDSDQLPGPESSSQVIRGVGSMRLSECRNELDGLRIKDTVPFMGRVIIDTQDDYDHLNDVVCLPLEDHHNRDKCYGLALVPVPSSTHPVPTFERVGVFWSWNRNPFDGIDATDFRIM